MVDGKTSPIYSYHMKKSHTFWVAFWQGIAAPTMFYAPMAQSHEIVSPSSGRTDLDAMRGDWKHVGGDFRKVIAREEASNTAS